MSDDKDLLDRQFAVQEVDSPPDVGEVISSATVKVDLLSSGFYHMTTRVDGANDGDKVAADHPLGKVSIMANLLVEVTKIVLQQQGTVENTIAWVDRCSGMLPDILSIAVAQMEARRADTQEAQETKEAGYQPDRVKLGG